mgnify:CR=1 FL=1
MKDNRTSVKRSLLVSAIALTLTAALLIGSTFAWFTSTASTGVNKIQAGNLDVKLLAEDGVTSLEGVTLEWQKAAGAEDEDILWEPGCRYLTKGFRIANKGNLALKWKVQVNKGTTAANDGNFDLLDVIDFYLVTSKDVDDMGTALDEFSGNLKKTETSDVYYIKGVMKTTADNDYQGLTLDGITITVYATQDTVENDSFNDQYDKDATYLAYPAGVTTDSFPENADYINDQGQTKSDKPATVAFVDKNGATQYAADLNTAIYNGASVVYCKKDAKLVGSLTRGNNRTVELTSDLTIYANGADFQNTEISINNTSLSTESVGKTKNFTLRVNDAKNLRVWGNTPNAGVTQNIILENCTFEGKGINSGNDVASGGIFYAYGETGTINLTMNNCKVSGSNQGVYLGCDGSLTVKDSSFTECATGIKVSYKGNGTRTDRIENCVFTKCGCTTEMAGGTTYLAADSAAIKYKKSGTGTITLTLKSNTITETLGDKGDTQFNGVTPVNE